MAEHTDESGTPPATTVEAVYLAGKRGAWDVVEQAFRRDPALAGRAVRHVKPSSGWTLLHQAAYWRSKRAARLCLAYGGSLGVADKAGKTPADVAAERGDAELAEWLRAGEVDGLWKPAASPTARASSCKWRSCDPASAVRVAEEDFAVAYGGHAVKIPRGRRYHVDDWGRVLIGWHGSYDPPRGMDDEPLL